VALESERAMAWVSARLGRMVRRTVHRVFGEELCITYETQGG